MLINKSQVIGLNPNSKLLKAYKDSLIALNAIQLEVAIGWMLGDASLQGQKNGKTFRLKFEWSDKNKAYVDHVYTIFDQWVLSSPHKKVRKSPAGNIVVNWGFQTISHVAFIPLADLFFLSSIEQEQERELSNKDSMKIISTDLLRGQKKSIAKDLIKNFLTPRGLSYWFMDDGGKLDYNKNSKNKSIVLNTHSFTDIEVSNMCKDLSEKFDLLCEVRSNKGKKIIVIHSSSYGKFRKLVDPYLIPEMIYKLP
jgi:hypothetical protein